MTQPKPETPTPEAPSTPETRLPARIHELLFEWAEQEDFAARTETRVNERLGARQIPGASAATVGPAR